MNIPITPLTFVIVCPLLFLAGFVDSIAGGGGLISLPAYLFAGLPVHYASGTNEFSSTFGSSVAMVRWFRQGAIPLKLAAPSAAAAFIGSVAGAHISLVLEERVLLTLMLVVLPFVAYVVLNRKIMKDVGVENERITGKTYAVTVSSALVIGMYDGLYGPGTGTFLIIALTVFAGLALRTAQGLTKAINVTSNVAALVVFFMNGQVVLPLAAAAALSNMAGNWCGSGMVMTKGTAVVRPIMILVLVLLFLKILTELFV